MVQSQYSLSWESYHTNICKGFSSLQQNGEFVDMTLAADGYFVKVHQVLMALASPYIKELISSAPCQHPVVFLNNVSHKTLSCLLEYIYTGEVLVPADNLSSFIEAAKSLHIKGLENIIGSDTMTVKMATKMSQMEDGELCHVSGIKRMALPASQQMGQIGLPAAARKICIKKEISPISSSNTSNTHCETQTAQDIGSKEEVEEYESMDDSAIHDTDDDIKQNINLSSETKETSNNDKPTTNLQFTVSIRGSLQIILNRYIYNLHSTTHRNRVRRWRCVDYRNHKCMAFVVTKDNIVTSRANLHNHSFHDKKILAKIEKKCVYSALDDIQGYNKDKEMSKMSDSDFMTLDDFDISDKPSELIKES